MEVCQILDNINKYRGRAALLWHSPGIPVFRKVAQEDSKFKTSLDYIVRHSDGEEELEIQGGRKGGKK